jgi:hypothetical protein
MTPRWRLRRAGATVGIREMFAKPVAAPAK